MMNINNHKCQVKIWLSALIVLLITFSVYIPALQNNFVNWDDNKYVYENINIRSLDYNFLKGALTSILVSNWHPLTVFSYAFDYALWGLNPLGYHLTNIIFHTANTLLVFILVLRLTSITILTSGKDKNITSHNDISINKNTLAVAIITALLFGIHPLHVESVTWISERKDMLYAFFYLLSMLSYLKYASVTDNSTIGNNKNFSKSRGGKFYIISLIMFILSILSKPMAVSLPIVLLLLDIYPVRRFSISQLFPSCKVGENHSSNKVFLEKVPFLVIASLSSLITIWAQKEGGALQSVEAYPLIDRLLIAVRAYIFYLLKMIMPINLAPIYPYPRPQDISLISFEYIGAFLLLIFITYICFRSAYTILPIIWCYYLITLIPVIGLVQVGSQAAADRYTYLPILGFFILAGIGIQYLLNRYSDKRNMIIFLIAGTTGIFCIMADLTIKQISVWKNPLTLWSYDIKLYPDTAYIAYHHRGLYYGKSGNYKQAISDFNKAININPQVSLAYINRGLTYFNMGDFNKALDDYSTVVMIDPKYTNAYYNRGTLYYKLGNYEQAINDFNKVVEYENKHSQAYNNRANVYYKIGNYKEAVKDFKNAIEHDPDNIEAYYNLSVAYSKLGDRDMASEFYNKAKQLGFNRR